jgi:sec-independent protein translocase protein TatA
MGSFSIWHWLVVLAIVLLLFGTGRVSNLMGDLAKGVKAFKKGLQEEEVDASISPDAAAPKALAADAAKPAESRRDEAARH